MNRIVKPELLDTLPPDDPRAVRSRRDLQRINACMGHPAIMAYALQKCFKSQTPARITELGAGDGDFLLRVLKKIPSGTRSHPSGYSDTMVTLVDLQKIISDKTLADFDELGWRVETVVADVFNWPPEDGDIVIANLFLHHFKDGRLTELLRLVSQRARVFIALEPRRAKWPLFCSHLLRAIGCNEVTRHDAVVSVRAGFSGYDLSTLWPDKNGWQLSEQEIGAFSHLFIATKRPAGFAPKESSYVEKLFGVR